MGRLTHRTNRGGPSGPTNDLPAFFEFPSLADETATYSALGWTRPNDPADITIDNFTVMDGGAIGEQDVHNAGEGDDLYLWERHVQRGYTGLAETYRDRWLTYFKGGQYRTDYQTYDLGYDNCHTYGWGLVLYAVRNSDSAALAEAEEIGDLAIEEWSVNHDSTTPPVPGTQSTGESGGRGIARAALLYTYLAEATTGSNKTKWEFWRDAMIDVYLESPDWQEADASNNIVIGGAYFCDRAAMDTNSQGGTAAYDAGRRSNATWQFALHAEFLIAAYRATERADIAARIVKFARFMLYYAHNPSDTTSGGPFCGSYFGHDDGARWHRDTAGSQNACMDASLVDLMVWGYKLSGDADMLTFARTLFRQGTRWEEGDPGDGGGALVTATQVYDYVDTRQKDGLYHRDNKGQLHSCAWVFENGGSPSLLTPTYVQGMSDFESRLLSGATYGPATGHVSPDDAIPTAWKSGTYTTATLWGDYGGGCEDRVNKRILFVAGGHSGTPFNGVMVFDANPDADGKPTGWSVHPGSYSDNTSASIIADYESSTVPDPLSDGRPNGTHNYYGMVYYPTGNLLFKLAHGGVFVPNGDGESAKYRVDLSNTSQPWTKLTSQGPLGGANLFSSDWAFTDDPDNPTKAYYGQVSSTQGAFFDMTDQSWSVLRNHGYQPDVASTGYAYDPLRGKAILFMGGLRRQFDPDFSAETVANDAAWSFDTGSHTSTFDRDQLSYFFDKDRYYQGDTANTRGVFWVYGGSVDSHFTSIVEFDPVTKHATQHSLTGTAPTVTELAGQSDQCRGVFNIHVFVPEWRCVFVSPNQFTGASVIKLPPPIE